MVPKIFQSSRQKAFKKSETSELQKGLVSQYAGERIDAVKRTIAAMTVGKDVSNLFPDVLKNLATRDVTLKKLVYLYLINYAKTHPDLCILAVNTFVKDSEEYNPTVRALAIRTMGCIRVTKIIDYLAHPLRKALKDDHPYVRKTAAVCVVKMFELDPEYCSSNGFISQLQALVTDPNPAVVTNAVRSLAEIHDCEPEKGYFNLVYTMTDRLIVALSECNEWGRITILSALSRLRTTDVKEAEFICERVIPQFQHANSGVVLAAVKVIMIHISLFSEEFRTLLYKKMAPPLLTLLSADPEIQYVALRNINLILQKQPDVFERGTRVFFCKYNDPLYIKLEKLKIITMLACEENINETLSELRTYASEVDLEFVKQTIKSLGDVALKVPSIINDCIAVFLEIFEVNISYMVQEVMVVMETILRQYPKKVQLLLPYLEKVLEELGDPRARASMAWILGEFCNSIGNSTQLLYEMVSSISQEDLQVQLALLTATVKLNLIMRNGESEALLKKIFSYATNVSSNQDLRDRAFMYQRLMTSKNLDTATSIVCSQKPTVEHDTKLPRLLLETLLSEMTTLASVYHKLPESFIGQGKFGADALQQRAVEELNVDEENNQTAIEKGANVENLLDLDFGGQGTATPTESTASPSISNNALDLFMSVESSAPSNQPPTAGHSRSATEDLLGL
ncbi:AP-1 adaptor complex beta subunit Apl2 [Schizosaccharomyces osmophilus]|uniref:AP complex subunit beta n=1 Tax=Schizosaccharomyces osmophilus TaxID=2545709 RepID=A0AAF0AVG5_9SCHI|nr:AP-1 adaptor complex beta subunit Apl2 [Schizosaccharomyces osmophilus]WBW71929.1 AP-1 adaptor complex beta subunit Apl2 [Schizosaccharomyces osmophilus]